MAEPRRENSVLFSLRELRGIEDERVRQEQDAEEARLSAERTAKEEAERKAKEEVERKARDEQERLAKIQAEKERQIREEQLRLEAEKHKAQVDAAAKLEQARIQADIQVKSAQKKMPLGLLLGSVGGVIAVAGGALAYVFLVVMPAREAELNRKSEEQVTSIRKQLKATLEDSERAQSDLKAKLQQTTDLAEKARIEAQMKENEAREAALKEQAVAAIKKVAPAKKPKDGAGASTTPKPGVPAKKLNCDPDKDPLCGSDI